jgi:hypothetical protein
MKIGVYTIIADNFGAQLQAYATAKFLTSFCHGHKVEMVKIKEEPKGATWKRVVKSFLPSYIKKRKAYQDFESLLPLTPESYYANELAHQPLPYDLYVVGSDQVWNISEGMGEHLVYFLPFHTKAPKIALASSFGTACIPQELKSEVAQYISDFSAISVRETDGVNILEDLGIKAEQVLDPTFWIDRCEWEKLACDKPIIKGDYIAAIGFETSNENPQKMMDSTKEIYGMPIIGLNTYRGFSYDKSYNTFGPKEFLNVIKYSKLVLTSSFHTLVFSLMFQKDFYLLKHSKRNSRMQNLLANFNLLDRMVDGTPDNYLGLLRKKSHIDYNLVNKKVLIAQQETQAVIKDIVERYI